MSLYQLTLLSYCAQANIDWDNFFEDMSYETDLGYMVRIWATSQDIFKRSGQIANIDRNEAGKRL